jgi:hypothetical protein
MPGNAALTDRIERRCIHQQPWIPVRTLEFNAKLNSEEGRTIGWRGLQA